ncbi:hypothetical protein G7Z17_g6229 [Cylindrodendrum hubeiense]|uniref:Alpha-type protein kinase domain-containing protein n=1 Tax=Cylindrodendrum hubeiense TaxID=595255 RepID=A0A9P5H537_9HYPO|nr:hypothetical protein G7Z17_g6229 [Cylindrodendrum hubeiense]
MTSRTPAPGPESISRLSTSTPEMQELALKMLHSSVGSRSASHRPAPTPESISRSSASQGEIQALARTMMHSSGHPRSSSSLARKPSSSIDIYSLLGDQPYSDSTTRRALLPAGAASSASASSGEATPSAVEAEVRLIRLRNQGNHAHANVGTSSIVGIFKNTCSTDLLFLIDTTGPMQPYIEAAKSQVISIMKDINTAFFHKAVVRMAVVGYKDHGDRPHIQYLDFTPDADKVCSFLNTLIATGGNDLPEDVLGGLQQALKASWKHPTRCIIHVTDAPPHGRTLHDFSDEDDRFPNPGNEPHCLTHGAFLAQMINFSINYALLRINGSTDRMAYSFFEAYAALSPDSRLHNSNTYYSAAVRLCGTSNAGFQGWSLSSKRAQHSPQFEELNLGTSYHHLRHLVVKIVTTSASRSATLTTSLSDEDDDSKVILETTSPQWDTPGWLNEVLECEAFSTDVVAHNNSMLDQMMVRDDNININTTDLIVHKRSWPFAQGAMRVAAYARSDASRNRLVVKSYKRKGSKFTDLIEDMRRQALCKAFALEFNAMLAEKYSLDFIVVTCLQPKSGAAKTGECLSLGPLIEGGEYVKYNSNGGWVNESEPSNPLFMATQAFSHFTFERSLGRFLVSDLQGVGHVLTDPAVHTRDPSRFPLVHTNLHYEGFMFFFATHNCNGVCKQLGLKSNAEMFLSVKFEFRKVWPDEMEAANMMICCPNKLCSKIVRMTNAKTSEEFPGYRWCDECWGELLWSTTKNICTARGPLHEFKLSRFFYVSRPDIAALLPQAPPWCRYRYGRPDRQRLKNPRLSVRCQLHLHGMPVPTSHTSL